MLLLIKHNTINTNDTHNISKTNSLLNITDNLHFQRK